MTEKRETPTTGHLCGATLDRLFNRDGDAPYRCVLPSGHQDPWHESDPGTPGGTRRAVWADWADGAHPAPEKRETDGVPEFRAGLVVQPGDTIVLALHDHENVGPEHMDAWVREVRKRLPHGSDVLFVGGVTPVVIRGTGRCTATMDDFAPGGGLLVRQCQRPDGHPGRHECRWDTGSVSWGA